MPNPAETAAPGPHAERDNTARRSPLLPTVDERLAMQLQKLGADRFAHVNGTLERHLHATMLLLRRWGNPEPVCLAGLYHAVYGTGGIRGRLAGLDARSGVAEVIGKEAEALAYLYGACDRERFHPRIGTPAQWIFVDRFTGCEYPITEAALRAFCEMTVANELELAEASVSFRERHRTELRLLFARMRGLISAAAHDAAALTLG
jgi:hypothetical protein